MNNGLDQLESIILYIFAEINDLKFFHLFKTYFSETKVCPDKSGFSFEGKIEESKLSKIITIIKIIFCLQYRKHEYV